MKTPITKPADSWDAVEKAISMRNKHSGAWEPFVKSAKNAIKQWPERSCDKTDIENTAEGRVAPPAPEE